MVGAQFASLADAIAGYSYWILVPAAIYYLWLVFKGGTEGRKAEEKDGKNILGWGKEKVNKMVRNSKTKLMNEYIEEEKELKLLDEVVKARDEALDVVKEILGKGEIKDVAEGKEVLTSVEKVKKALDTARKEFRRLKSRTWRQERRFDKLVKEFKDKDKDVARLDMLEKQILEKHNEAIGHLDDAINEYGTVLPLANTFNTEFTKISGSKVIVWPHKLVVSGPSKSRLSPVRAPLMMILPKLEALDVKDSHFKKAEEAEKAAITAVNAVILEARELKVFN